MSPMLPDALLVARGVAAGYPLPNEGRRQVLRGVDLHLGRGEMAALVGTNGSGKTTLLRCLAGVLPIEAGEIVLDGRPLDGWSRLERARRVAVLPQHLELPAGFRVSELVAMGRVPHARSLFGSSADDERAVAAALADGDALDLADRFVEELSGGERQRALVAMALAQEPQLLLLDEPTLHLDLAHQAALLTSLHRLRRQRGLAVLAVLHDLNLAAAFAPRVIVLDAGRVAADGEPDQVLTPALVERVFGVTVDEVRSPDGRRSLALRIATPVAAAEG